jgi:hypothetical protein
MKLLASHKSFNVSLCSLFYEFVNRLRKTRVVQQKISIAELCVIYALLNFKSINRGGARLLRGDLARRWTLLADSTERTSLAIFSFEEDGVGEFSVRFFDFFVFNSSEATLLD